jgi:hypothetical protein
MKEFLRKPHSICQARNLRVRRRGFTGFSAIPIQGAEATSNSSGLLLDFWA